MIKHEEGRCIITTWFDFERHEKTYGLWKMKALQEISVSGTIVHVGDTFKIAGNIACQLAMHRDAEFVDVRTA